MIESENPKGFYVAVCMSCIAFVFLTCGCSEPNPLGRCAVSGAIRFDGDPLDHGMIEFSPTDPAGHSSGGKITDGEYSIEAHLGLPPGEYKVRITSPTSSEPADAEQELQPPGPQDGTQPPPAVERIPKEFNTKSEQLVEVKESGDNKFDFDVPARKKR